MENRKPGFEEKMAERFGKDSVLALATVWGGRPHVRYVNAYYEDGAFYIVTYGLSNKMKHIAEDPAVGLAGEWFTGHGLGESLGAWGLDENRPLTEKLEKAFSQWLGNGHTDLEDENTVILRVRLTDGLLLSHGARYEMERPVGL